MTVKQISVFLENKAGCLAEFTNLLSENNINMRALSVAENPDFWILRVIVDDVYKTSSVLKEADYVFSITPVLAVEFQDVSGGLAGVVDVLEELSQRFRNLPRIEHIGKECNTVSN